MPTIASREGVRMTTEPDFVRGDPKCHYKALTVDAQTPVDPDSAVDSVVYLSTDRIDSDGEVLIPSGCDFSRFNKNPVLFLNHAQSSPAAAAFYPLPLGRVAWTKVRPHGILGGIIFARNTDMARDVKGLWDEECLRTVSVGFLPIEASPMTRDEANSRPDWKAEFDRRKGKVLVHRRYMLLELSIVGIPANEDAVKVKYQSKGLHVPAWLQLPEPAETQTMLEATDAALGGDETKSLTPKCPDGKCDGECHEGKDMGDDGDDMETMSMKPGDHVVCKAGCGTLKSVHDKGMHEGYGGELEANTANPIGKVDLHEREDDKCMGKPTGNVKAFPMAEMKPHAETKAMAEGSGTAGGYTTKPDDEETKADAMPVDEDPGDEPDDDFDEDDMDEAGGFKRGDHVHIRAHKSHGGYKGFGEIERIHKSGHVGDVDNDMMATSDEPAARVKCYRKMGDGHVPTDTKLGVKLKCLKAMDAPMKPPTAMKAAEPAPARATPNATKGQRLIVDPLPPLVAMSEAEVQAEVLRKAEEGRREAAKAAVAEVQRLFGVV